MHRISWCRRTPAFSCEGLSSDAAKRRSIDLRQLQRTLASGGPDLISLAAADQSDDAPRHVPIAFLIHSHVFEWTRSPTTKSLLIRARPAAAAWTSQTSSSR